MAINPRLLFGWGRGVLTETCPDRKLGLMGDVTEMDGPTFWESKELEPVEQTHIRQLRSGPPTHRTNSLEFSWMWLPSLEDTDGEETSAQHGEPGTRNQQPGTSTGQFTGISASIPSSSPGPGL